MYEFYYSYIKIEYKNCAKVLFTGTYSLVYEVETS